MCTSHRIANVALTLRSLLVLAWSVLNGSVVLEISFFSRSFNYVSGTQCCSRTKCSSIIGLHHKVGWQNISLQLQAVTTIPHCSCTVLFDMARFSCLLSEGSASSVDRILCFNWKDSAAVPASLFHVVTCTLRILETKRRGLKLVITISIRYGR